MAEPTPKPKPGKGAKGGLGKKVGPLPAWGWGLIVLAVLGYFLFFRRSNSGTVAGVVSTGQTAGTPLDANAGAINAAQAGQPSTATAPADGLDPSTQGYLLTTPSDLSAALTTALGNAYATGLGPYATATGAGFDTGQHSTDLNVIGQATATAPVATAKPTASGGTAPKALQPFGGIISKKKLKNGATLTSYANGRQVEQMPGKSAYVVRAGR
jgi:hypothetical protein